MTLVLSLLIVQALMGAVDTFLHHEFAAGLPSRPGARRELLSTGLFSLGSPPLSGEAPSPGSCLACCWRRW